MAITKVRSCRLCAGCVPAGTELVFQTNSPNCYPGNNKVKEKLIELGYSASALKNADITGVFKVVKD